MEDTYRKKSEKNIAFWFAVIGVPIGIFVAIFTWIGLNIILFLPISILIGLLCGLGAYTYLLRQDIKDRNIEIKKLKTKLRRKIKDVKENKNNK